MNNETVSPKLSVNVRSEDDFLQDQAQLMRAGVYEMLAALLAREPGSELLQALADLDEIDTSEGQIAMGWELLRQASRKTSTDAVRDEYFNLFLGVGRGELVPFGSWYMTGFLMEKPVSHLRTDLSALGIERQDGVAESEDHIAGLCDAMALMIRSSAGQGSAESEAGEAEQTIDVVGFDRQGEFFRAHIEPWAQRFFADLQTAKAAHFYRAVGFFGESFIEFEQQLFNMKS